MKLIDKDYAVNTAWSIDAYHGSAREVCEMLEDAPTVDAVPVIRCKDCKYWQLEHYVGGQGMSCQMDNSDDVCLTEPTHFCAWAERKEE